jgi:hypothetical protein
MNAWDNLPNAKHINWVLSSVKANPEAWKTSWDKEQSAAWHAARNAACGAARDAAQDAAQDAAWTAAWTAALDAARNAAYDAAYDAMTAAHGSAWGAVSALIAFDHCEKYLKMTPEELLVWWKLSEDPACLLLMPMIKVKNERLG